MFVGSWQLVVLVCELRIDVSQVKWLLLPDSLLQELENVGSVLVSVYEVPMLEQFVHLHALLEVEAQITERLSLVLQSDPHELNHKHLNTVNSQLKKPFHGN